MEVVTKVTTTKTVVTQFTSKSVKTSNRGGCTKNSSKQTTKRDVNRKKHHHGKQRRTTRIARKSAGRRAQRSTDNMKKAITAVKTNQLGLNEAARTYSVPKATLLRHAKRLNMHAHDGEKKLGRASDLPAEVERDLVDHILLLESRLYGLTRDSLLRLAFQTAKANDIQTRFNGSTQKAGKEWLKGFLSRHPEISLRSPEPTSLARAAGFNRQHVGKFFELLQKIAADENLTPERI